MEELSSCWNRFVLPSTFLEWFVIAISGSVENVVRSVLRPLSLVVFALALAPGTPAAEVEIARAKAGEFVGVAGCKSSSCHGGAGEKHDQYLTWVQKDFHARAYAILTNARSARIAETLGVSTAQESNRCTVCHSPFQSVAPARLA